jgi:hypothetical protein
MLSRLQPRRLPRIALGLRSVLACSRDGVCRCRTAVLLLYVVMNLGLPIGGSRPQAGPTSIAGSCRCSPESRAAGRCCCARIPGQSSCCLAKSKSKPDAKSCCAKSAETPSTRVIDSIEHQESAPAWTAGCPCPVDLPLVLICPQPRILSDATTIVAIPNQERAMQDPAGSPCGHRPRPVVPPPEFFLV